MTEQSRIVLDTNVIVSALAWQGKPARFFDLAGDGTIALFSSPALLNEFRQTISRPKFADRLRSVGLSVAVVCESVAELVTIIEPAILTQRFSRDPDDDHVIACAIAARADYLVTGDDDLLVLESIKDIRIRRVAEALDELAQVR